jgi:hypothetical protein
MSKQVSNHRKRSRTKCEKLRALKGTTTIDFDENGSPIGKYANNFASFAAMLVKDSVACTYASWKDVPEDVKNDIWAEIKVIIFCKEFYKLNMIGKFLL